jgi:hypothetical protein
LGRGDLDTVRGCGDGDDARAETEEEAAADELRLAEGGRDDGRADADDDAA